MKYLIHFLYALSGLFLVIALVGVGHASVYSELSLFIKICTVCSAVLFGVASGIKVYRILAEWLD